MCAQITQEEAHLVNAAVDQEKIKRLNQLAWQLRFTDLERAIELSQQAAHLAATAGEDGLPFLPGVAHSLYQLGLFEMQRGFYPPALEWLLRSLQAYETIGEAPEIMRGLNACGRVYIYLNNYPKALEAHLKALQLAQGHGDAAAETATLNALGALFIHRGQWKEAEGYLRQSRMLAQKLKDTQAEADALASCCVCYFQMGDDENALASGCQSLQMYQSIGAQQGEAEVLNSLGVIYQAKGDHDQALAQFEKSLHLFIEIGDRLEAARLLQRISALYLSTDDVTQALDSLKRGLSLAQAISSFQEQRAIHHALADIYKDHAQPALSLMHLEMADTLEESIYPQENIQPREYSDILSQSENDRQQVRSFQLKNVALQQEINERRQAEQALRQANDALRREVSERERLIADLNAFTQMVAHDLKHPLSAITGYATLLSDELEGTESADARQYLDVIVQTSFRMCRIIDEMLLLSSVREQSVVTRPLDMQKIVEEVLARLNLLLEQSRAEVIQPSTWPVAVGYGPWVEEIWANYISNAVKYGGTPPRVELGAWRGTDGQIHFWVKDNGHGLSPEEQQKLFTSYTRLDRATGQGHGLGLSIVRRILERLNGKFSVECVSYPNGGCTFSFTLPAAVTADLT